MLRCKTLCWLSLSLALAACRLDSEPALRVGTNIWPGYEPMYLARRLGYYDEHLINLIDFPSSVDVMRAYRNGVIDVAALTADEALSVVATEPGRHRVFLIADFSNGADCILAQPWISDFTQLKGRRIGVESNALGAYVLLRALQIHGMTVTNIMPVPVSLEQHEQTFKAKSVDAIVTFEPRCSRLLAAGAHSIFDSKEIPGEITDVLLARESLVDTRRATLTQLTQGWFGALHRLQEERNAMANLAAMHLSVAPEMFLNSLQGLRWVDRAENLRLLGGDPPGISQSFGNLARTMRTQGLLTANVDATMIPDRRVVEQTPP